MDLDLSGGYSRFSGARLEGPNGSILFVPSLKVGENLALLPILTADYQKSRDVQDLAGGGFITVAQQSRGASLKAIEAVGPVKLKVYGAYKENLLKDAVDEPWGKGLFDYTKTAGGVEVEGKGPLAAVDAWRAGLDTYVTKFPNFKSLASQQTGVEINSGTNVLNFTALEVPLGVDLASQNQRVELRALTSFRRFGDQNIISDDGTFSGDHRRDLYWSLTAGATRLLPKTSLGGSLESAVGLDAGYDNLHSNQNSFDAAVLSFHSNFYSYSETSVGPRYRFRWRGWLTGGLSYVLAFRDYNGRPAQDLDGADRAHAIRTRTQTARLNLSVPVGAGFSAQLQAATQHADSNTAFETTYRYNYTSSNYFLGVTYEL